MTAETGINYKKRIEDIISNGLGFDPQFNLILGEPGSGLNLRFHLGAMEVEIKGSEGRKVKGYLDLGPDVDRDVKYLPILKEVLIAKLKEDYTQRITSRRVLAAVFHPRASVR